MDELNEIEESLSLALQHRPAPPGFAAGVMARIASAQTPTATPRGATGTLLRMRPAARWWAAAAAALLLTVGGGNALHLHRVHQAQREQAAEKQVDLAMQLTSYALTEVENKLDRSPAGRYTHLGD